VHGQSVNTTVLSELHPNDWPSLANSEAPVPLTGTFHCGMKVFRKGPHSSQSFRKADRHFLISVILSHCTIFLELVLGGFCPPLSLIGCKDNLISEPHSDKCRPTHTGTRPYKSLTLHLLDLLNQREIKKKKNSHSITRIKIRTQNQKPIAHSYPIIAKDI
jgi:hypothetical protein